MPAAPSAPTTSGRRIDTPKAWRVEEKEAQDTANTAWWHQFEDDVLNGLIDEALKQNNDLRVATARVDEYVGRYWVGRSGLFPQIGANAFAGQNRISEQGASTAALSGLKNPTDSYQANFTGSWEIDIWGKLRRATEASRADLLSTEEARQAVILSLVSAVANGYISLRDFDKQLEIATRTAKTREESYKLFKLRYEGGVISELELNQVKSEYEQALATIPQVEKQIGFQENALSVLLGRNPGPIDRGKSIDELALPAVPAGLPSDLLEKRPDVRQAEQALVAANARIGVAKAQFFPTISLTGLFGWASTELSSLFTGPAQVWSWGGAAVAPIFTGGSLLGQFWASEAIQQQTLFNYQSTVQTAFREVNDALIDQRRTREQLEAQKRQVDSLKEYARIARLRYDNGYTSYIEVLDAERSLFSAELTYAQTQGVLFVALVNLYKSMGGGWVVEADKLTSPETAHCAQGRQGRKGEKPLRRTGMKPIHRHVTGFWSEERSLTAFLILLIVEIFFLAPLQITGLAFRFINGMVFVLLLLVGLLTMTKRKEFQALATMIVVLAIVTRVARRFFGVAGLEILDGLLMLLCTIGFLVIVLWQVYREGPVTAHRIQGAVAGYLLLSVIFAVAYSLAETIQPGSFQMSSVQDQVRAELVMDRSFYYFSVVTLTTTGYGDITALSNSARTLVMMEALIGQLYTAILIARLVSLHVETKREKRGGHQ